MAQRRQLSTAFTSRAASHQGVQVLPAAGCAEGAFVAELRAALARWECESRLAVWLLLDVKDMHLCRAAHELGFSLHSAKGRKSAMVKWLPKDIPCKVPPFGFHQSELAGPTRLLPCGATVRALP